MIYDDYIEYTKTYQRKYGEKTVVFMQVGDFFELYAVDNDTEKAGADIYTVCDICNIQVSRKNKTILENNRQNPLMAGFPIAIVSKHIQTLVHHGYTVVMIRQVTPPPNPRREVTEIISPSTNTQTQGSENTYLMTLYWENNPIHYQSTRSQWSVGMCCIDVTTGDVCIGEAFPQMADKHYAKDEAYRWIQSIQPREIILVGDPVDKETLEDLYNSLQIRHLRLFRTVHELWGHENLGVFRKTSYQEQVLQKIYGKTCGVVGSVTEALDLSRNDFSRMAMMYSIQFVYEHNEKMMDCLKLPVNHEPVRHLNVHYNGLTQLNVISHVPGEKPLLTILNRCATAFGSRLFKEHLLNPLISTAELQTRYDMVEWFLKCPDHTTMRKHLGAVLDLERFARRLVMEQLAPCEWVSIAHSFDSIRKMLSLLETHLAMPQRPEKLWNTYKCLIDHVNTVQRMLDDDLVLEEATKYWLNDIRGSVFCKGKFIELDELQDCVQGNIQQLRTIADALSVLLASVSTGGGAGNVTEQGCKLEYNERDGYYLSMTKKRWETLLTRTPANYELPWIDGDTGDEDENNKAEKTLRLGECKTKPVSSSSSILKITHVHIESLSHRIQAEQKTLGLVATEAYMDFIRTHKFEISKCMFHIVSLLAELDVSLTHARNAEEYCYSRPILHEGTKSFVRAQKLRHPIIERIQSHTPYVPNDVDIGKDVDGWLLYGINASGKSSLMKAIGLNVLMAQAGSFVPCEKLTLQPYHYIFTRISGADNIYRGMSSFTVEMSELRNILLRCNANSLVLGDELCAGTESISALSIVAAGIDALAKQRASFVFATHLHELLDMECIPENVEVFHIHIELDENTGKIVYDRNLTKGHGHAYYGLEVCKALQLPEHFLHKAHMYRRKIQKAPNTFVNAKTSNYNKEVYIDKCLVCGNRASETHHIGYQKTASQGFIGHIGVHSKANLVPLCEECHAKEHQGTISIEGFVQTSEGRELKVKAHRTSTSAKRKTTSGTATT